MCQKRPKFALGRRRKKVERMRSLTPSGIWLERKVLAPCDKAAGGGWFYLDLNRCSRRAGAPSLRSLRAARMRMQQHDATWEFRVVSNLIKGRHCWRTLCRRKSSAPATPNHTANHVVYRSSTDGRDRHVRYFLRKGFESANSAPCNPITSVGSKKDFHPDGAKSHFSDSQKRLALALTIDTAPKWRRWKAPATKSRLLGWFGKRLGEYHARTMLTDGLAWACDVVAGMEIRHRRGFDIGLVLHFADRYARDNKSADDRKREWATERRYAEWHAKQPQWRQAAAHLKSTLGASLQPSATIGLLWRQLATEHATAVADIEAWLTSQIPGWKTVRDESTRLYLEYGQKREAEACAMLKLMTRLELT